MDQSDRWEWAYSTAHALDKLKTEEGQLREELGTHSECRRILQGWGTLIQELGVLRTRDALEICPTPFMEWKFGPTSHGAYLDATLHVLAYRDGVSHRAILRMREYVGISDGKVFRYKDDNGEDSSAGVYISNTTLPDKAREIVNTAILRAWEYMGEELIDILRECVAYEVAKELKEGNTYKALRLVKEYGAIK